MFVLIGSLLLCSVEPSFAQQSGTITYTYSGPNNGVICADLSPATVVRTENGKSTTYVHTNPDNYSSTTVITLPDGGTQTVLARNTTLYSDIVKDSGNI